MGLHRTHSSSPEAESVFWNLFQNDRFTSLLLGLPYGIAESHCDMRVNGKSIPTEPSPEMFVVRLVCIAGRITDRTQGTGEPSYASALDTDQELDSIAAQLPRSWWDIASSPAADDPVSAAEWQEIILGQICFHQTRIYLHMPFMLQSTTNPRYEYSRTACLEGAREMLRLYHLLRGRGKPPYDCKAVDFLAFTACIFLILSLLGYGRLAPVQNVDQDTSDWETVDRTTEILRCASSEKGGNVAAQSYQALELIGRVRNTDCTAADTDTNYSAKIVIPYFGTISVRRNNKFHNQAGAATTSSSRTSVVTPGSSTSSNTNMEAQQALGGNSGYDPLIAYDGFYLPNNSFNQQQVSENPLVNYMFANSAVPGQSLANMDIDQDWSWFMADPQQPQLFT